MTAAAALPDSSSRPDAAPPSTPQRTPGAPARTNPTFPRPPWWQRYPGPVFQKDIWILGKRPSTAWIRGLYALGLMAIALLVLYASSAMRANSYSYSYNGSPETRSTVSSTADLQRFQGVAPAVTMAVIWFQYVCLTLAACALCGPSICDDRRAGTLGTLLTTPLSASQIVAGKLGGRVTELLILTLLSAPILLALRVLGGVTAFDVVASTALCLVTALVAGQASMYFSARSKNPTTAIVLGILVTLAVVLAPLIITWVVALTATNGMRAGPPSWIGLAPMLSSPVALGLVSANMNEGNISRMMGGLINLPMIVVGNIAIMLGVWALLYTATTLALRRVMASDAAGAVAPVKPGKKTRNSKGKAAATSPPPATSADAPAPDTASIEAAPGLPPRKKRRVFVHAEGSSRVVGDNPVLWRELETVAVMKRWQKITICTVGPLALVALAWLAQMDDGFVPVIATILLLILLLHAGVVCASSIAGEREGKSLDTLLTTPISAWDVAVGKALGGVRKTAIYAAVILAFVLVFGVLGELWGALLEPIDALTPWMYRSSWNASVTHPIALLWTILIIAGPAVFLPCLGVFLSTLTKRTTAAAVLTILIALVLWAGVPLGIAIFHDVFRDISGGTNMQLGNLASAMNPVYLLASMLGRATRSYHSGSMNLRIDSMGSGGDWHFGMFGYTLLLTGVLAVYCAGAWACLRAASRIIANQTGRAA